VSSVDDYGNETFNTEMIAGQNHFAIPRVPYIFLNMFNLGKQPVDETGLINQNLSNQDLINKRVRQIDRNADSMNSGMVVSLERSGLTKDQAALATEALRLGNTIAIPAGSPREAVDRFPGTPLPNDVYNNLQDTRVRVRGLFGTGGLTGDGIKNETTVRGKILIRGLDSDRIGGGITEYIEQFADDIYNWMVQLMFVFYPEMTGDIPKTIISVKEGSLLPQDTTSLANQAIELAAGGLLDPISLFEKLEFPDPEGTAAKLFIWKTNPMLLFKNNPEIQEMMGQMMPPQGMPSPQGGGTPPIPQTQTPDAQLLNQVPIQ